MTSERLLLQRTRAGQSDAFDQLFQQHKDSIYACLWHLLDGDEELVEEAVGNVFLNAYRALPGFREKAAFSTWLYRIAVNEAHALRKRKQRQQSHEGVPFDEDIADGLNRAETSDPATGYARAEEERLLVQAVRALPEPYRTPVMLRYFSGLAASDVAKTLNRPAGTVRYQVSRALQILRERLGSEWQR